MSLEDETVELSLAYHGQRERTMQLEQLLREYYLMLQEYEKCFFFRNSEAQRENLQQRTKAALGPLLTKRL